MTLLKNGTTRLYNQLKDTSKNVTFINQKLEKSKTFKFRKTFNDNSFTKGGLINEFERNKAEREQVRSEEPPTYQVDQDMEILNLMKETRELNQLMRVI